jgi:hypothetical protein
VSLLRRKRRVGPRAGRHASGLCGGFALPEADSEVLRGDQDDERAHHDSGDRTDLARGPAFLECALGDPAAPGLGDADVALPHRLTATLDTIAVQLDDRAEDTQNTEHKGNARPDDSFHYPSPN